MLTPMTANLLITLKEVKDYLDEQANKLSTNHFLNKVPEVTVHLGDVKRWIVDLDVLQSVVRQPPTDYQADKSARQKRLAELTIEIESLRNYDKAENEEAHKHINGLVREGKLQDAVREYRKLTGCGLREAYDFVQSSKWMIRS